MHMSSSPVDFSFPNHVQRLTGRPHGSKRTSCTYVQSTNPPPVVWDDIFCCFLSQRRIVLKSFNPPRSPVNPFDGWCFASPPFANSSFCRGRAPPAFAPPSKLPFPALRQRPLPLQRLKSPVPPPLFYCGGDGRRFAKLAAPLVAGRSSVSLAVVT